MFEPSETPEKQWFLFGWQTVDVYRRRKSGQISLEGKDPELLRKYLHNHIRRQPEIEDCSVVYLGTA
jgi:hypothetical protein